MLHVTLGIDACSDGTNTLTWLFAECAIHWCGRNCEVRVNRSSGVLTGEDSDGCSDHEDEELELNDPPLVLELVLGALRVRDDVGGALRTDRRNVSGSDLDCAGNRATTTRSYILMAEQCCPLMPNRR